MSSFRTPGVYIVESDDVPSSIVGVETAVPAFVGYTQRAGTEDGDSLHLIPQRIASLAEYHALFGGAAARRFHLSRTAPAGERLHGRVELGTTRYHLVEAGRTSFVLEESVALYFANGGGACFICSCGTFADDSGAEGLLAGLAAVGVVREPTMLAVPDAARLPTRGEHARVVVAMLEQARLLGDRMALIDVWSALDGSHDVAAVRADLATLPVDALSHGAVYHPALVTAAVSPDDLDLSVFAPEHRRSLATALSKAGGGGDVASLLTSVGEDGGAAAMAELRAQVPGFEGLLAAIATACNTVPPSGAVAGAWVAHDAAFGVWMAPANVSLAGTAVPAEVIDQAEVEDLVHPADGLAINAIRALDARGAVIWGARTLAGNSQEWRYIPVRRTTIYIAQSIRLGLATLIFSPNTATTWVTATSMIASFLQGVWATGGLLGAKPAEAFSVTCGLGSTMTSDDIINGAMIVDLVLQVGAPGEFIELVLKQEMQGGAP